MMPLARFLSIFALIAMISAPAMACCITGHHNGNDHQPGQVLEPAAYTGTHNCHDPVIEGSIPQPPADPTPSECMDYVDCDSTMSNADRAFKLATMSSLESIDLPSVMLARFQGFEPPRLSRTTGPPFLLVFGQSTPVGLKQLLLI